MYGEQQDRVIDFVARFSLIMKKETYGWKRALSLVAG